MEEQKNLRNIIPNHGPDFFIQRENPNLDLNEFSEDYPCEDTEPGWRISLHKFSTSYIIPSEELDEGWITSCVIGSNIYLIGQYIDKRYCQCGKAESKGKYLSLKLREIAGMNLIKTYMKACASNDRFIYAFGWNGSSSVFIGEKYDIKLDKWSSIPPTIIRDVNHGKYLIQAMSTRYIYIVFNNDVTKLIYKLDILDQESGWTQTSHKINQQILAFSQITPYTLKFWAQKSEFTLEKIKGKLVFSRPFEINHESYDDTSKIQVTSPIKGYIHFLKDYDTYFKYSIKKKNNLKFFL